MPGLFVSQEFIEEDRGLKRGLADQNSTVN